MVGYGARERELRYQTNTWINCDRRSTNRPLGIVMDEGAGIDCGREGGGGKEKTRTIRSVQTSRSRPAEVVWSCVVCGRALTREGSFPSHFSVVSALQQQQ
jgi:hypothetical protein